MGLVGIVFVIMGLAMGAFLNYDYRDDTGTAVAALLVIIGTIMIVGELIV